MLGRIFERRWGGVACTGLAMAVVGGAGGFFSDHLIGALVGLAGGLLVGVGVGFVLVVFYSNHTDEEGEPIAGMPRMNAGSLPTGVEE
jgi:hypothetical protein